MPGHRPSQAVKAQARHFGPNASWGPPRNRALAGQHRLHALHGH